MLASWTCRNSIFAARRLYPLSRKTECWHELQYLHVQLACTFVASGQHWSMCTGSSNLACKMFPLNTCAHTHTHTHARTHIHTRTHTHTHMHIIIHLLYSPPPPPPPPSSSPSPPPPPLPPSPQRGQPDKVDLR